MGKYDDDFVREMAENVEKHLQKSRNEYYEIKIHIEINIKNK